jgi:hypothetical protein
MTSPGSQASRAELAERLSNLTQASGAVWSELAITMCENSKIRLEARRLRQDSSCATAESAAFRQKLELRRAEATRGVADAIVQILSSLGYCAFVAAQPQDSASIQ